MAQDMFKLIKHILKSNNYCGHLILKYACVAYKYGIYYNECLERHSLHC